MRATNKTIAEKLFSLKGDVAVLFQSMDFVTNSEENSFVYESKDVRTLARTIKLIEEALEPVKCNLMTPEEREKYELIKANNKAFAEK